MDDAPARTAGARRAGVVLLGLAVTVAVAVALMTGSRPLPPSAAPATATTAAPAPPRGTTSQAGPTETGGAVTPSTQPPALAGVHVVLDAGHNGGNAAAPGQVNAPVGDGRGARKACNTVGTSTASGYPEHAFTFDVVARLRAILEADGATVTLTREDDTGVGPCVDVRGRSAQEAGADVLVSVHADGAEDPSVRGFFAIVSEPPLNDAQGEPSRELAAALLGALAGAGFTPAAAYPGALSERADLATLNWSERPAVLLELAQMRNPEEAAVAESAEGRQRYAEAVAAGLRAWAAR